MAPTYTKQPKFSYSRLNAYELCSFRYKLTYEDKHFFFSDTAANMFGTLVHYTEEQIGKCLKDGLPIDYEKLKNDFITLNIPKANPYDQKGGVFGVDIIKQKFPVEFARVDDNGESFEKKTERYLKTGIYRLENYLKMNPALSIYGTEMYFEITVKGQMITGSLDRVYFNSETNEFIIEDIKTKDKPFKAEELMAPLQFVIYTKALSSMTGVPMDRISCTYDLPIINMKQPAGSPGYVTTGLKKLEEIVTGISAKDYPPNPSPLCAYCSFSATNAHQPEAAKHLCPYYSLWTPDKRTRGVALKYRGPQYLDEDIATVFGPSKIEGLDDFDFEF